MTRVLELDGVQNDQPMSNEAPLDKLAGRISELERQRDRLIIHLRWTGIVAGIVLGILGFKVSVDFPKQLNKFTVKAEEALQKVETSANEAEEIVEKMKPSVRTIGNSVNGQTRFGNMQMCWGRQEARISDTAINYEDPNKPVGNPTKRISLNATFGYRFPFSSPPAVTCSVLVDQTTSGPNGEAAPYNIYNVDTGEESCKTLRVNMLSVDQMTHTHTVWVNYLAIGEVQE